MSENRSRGSVLILITSPLILLGGIVLRVKSIMDITGENRSIATMHLIFTVAISLFAYSLCFGCNIWIQTQQKCRCGTSTDK